MSLSSDLYLSCSFEAWKVSPEILLPFPGHLQISFGDLYPSLAISENQMRGCVTPRYALTAHDALVVRKIKGMWREVYEALELVIGENNLMYAFPHSLIPHTFIVSLHAQGINSEKMQDVTIICFRRQIIRVSKGQGTGGIDYPWMKRIGRKFASLNMQTSWLTFKEGGEEFKDKTLGDKHFIDLEKK